MADRQYTSSATIAMSAASAPRSRVATFGPWALAAVTLAAGLGIGARVLAPKADVRPLRLSIPVPSELPPVALRLSPDGNTLAYVSGQGDRLSIYTRRLDDLRPRRLEGTDDGFAISFSPDGQSIAYLGTNNSPRKVPIGGGTSVAIPVEGGAGLTAIEFDGPDRFMLDVNVAWAGYADGFLVWALPDGTIFGAPWDLRKKEPVGSGTPLGATVLSILGFLPPVSVGPGGLAYVPTQSRALVQVDRSGRSTILLGTDRSYHNPRVSPDGRRISMDFTEQERDVWLFDIADSTLTRFGFDSTAHDAEWMPDGSGLLFAVVRNGSIGEYRRQFDKGGRADSVFFGPEQISIHAVTADQRTGIGVVIEGSAFDIVAVNLEGPARFDTLLATRYSEGWPALSPDNRWLAYQSDESGRMEVYLRAWPSLGSKVQVSQNGGTEPTWSRDGRELFYRSGGGAEPRMVAATLAGGRVQTRTELFSVGRFEFSTPHRNYDVFPDGRSFVMVRQGTPGQQAEVVYLQNLPGLMERR